MSRPTKRGKVNRKRAQARQAGLVLGRPPAVGPAAREQFQVRDDQHLAPIAIAKQGEDDRAILIGDDPPDLVIPTVALRSICAIARDEDLEMAMDAETEKRLAPDGRHMLNGMRRVVNSDNSDFVRARVMMQMRDLGRGQPYEQFLDFPTRYIGMLLDASKLRKEESLPEVSPSWRWKGKKPTWAGCYAFDKVWRQAENVAVAAYDHPERQPGEIRIPPRHLSAMTTLAVLQDAHLVRVEPEQVSVLPEWDDYGNLWDYAQDVTLPFEKLFLDFEGPGEIAPVFRVPHGLTLGKLPVTPADPKANDVQIRGALVWRDNAQRLCVTVVAWPTAWRLGEMVNLMAGDPKDPLWNEYEIAGTITFGPGGPLRLEDEMGEVEVRLGDSGVLAYPLALATHYLTNGMYEGFAQMPVDRLDVERAISRSTDDLRDVLGSPDGLSLFVGGWAIVVLAAAGRVLAALSILEADEVEIVDAPMEKRERDRADKRGWNISKIVKVRPSKKYLVSNPPSGEEARYSHRFWVRAHVKHFPLGTRVADTRPDLCKPCHRCGSCRRVNTKAFIKGPDDKPLVPKSLVVSKNAKAHLPERIDEQTSYKAPSVV